MGYTHYWKTDQPFTKSQWDALCVQVKLLLKNSEVALRFEDDSPHPPVVNKDQIHFNGVGDDGHETFVLRRSGENFAFCKTARKPYDTIVTAILILAHNIGNDFEVTSDGNAEDWVNGQEYLLKTIGAIPDSVVHP